MKKNAGLEALSMIADSPSQLARYAIDYEKQVTGNNFFHDWDHREEGSLRGIIVGLTYALGQIEKPFSVETIKCIHRFCCNHVRDMNPSTLPGEFRERWFRAYKIQPGFSFSREGLFEAIRRQNKYPYQLAGYIAQIKNISEYEAAGIQLDKETISTLLNNPKPIERTYMYAFTGGLNPDELEELSVLFNEHYEIYSEDHGDALCGLYDIKHFRRRKLEVDSPRFTELKTKLHRGIEAQLNTVINKLYSDLASVSTEDDKLYAIVEAIKQFEEIHPFNDGNCRTFGIVFLNSLLVQQGFLPTLLDNPNHFDGYSASELVEEIKIGFDRTKRLLEEIKTNNFKEFHYREWCGPYFIKGSLNEYAEQIKTTYSKLTASEEADSQDAEKGSHLFFTSSVSSQRNNRDDRLDVPTLKPKRDTLGCMR